MADMALFTAAADEPLACISENIANAAEPLEEAVEELQTAVQLARRGSRRKWALIGGLALLVAVGTGIIIWLALK
jgi:t-SNARE complex subunit (syntaxin)